MNIYIPSQSFDASRSEVPVWNRWCALLTMEVVLNRRKCEEWFRKWQRNTKAFIIALWENETSPLPTKYMGSYHGVKRCINDIYDVATWTRFGDETLSENPKQWRSLKRTLQVLNEMRPHQGDQRVGIVYWCHPEQIYAPEDFHRLMDGFKLPGSPKQ